MNKKIYNIGYMQFETLIIDDDTGTAEYIRTLAAEDAAMNVRVFNDSSEALAYVKANKVHIIVLDIVLPGIDGVELLRQIKEHDPLVHVIMITIDSSFGRVLTSFKYGALDFLVKPFEPEEIQEVLRLSRERWERWAAALAVTSIRERLPRRYRPDGEV
jgi:DNA-binding NtrC family response regulator